MWEVDPETKSKVTMRIILPLFSLCPLFQLIVSLAPRTPKAPRERPLLRLPRSVAAMGLAQIRHLHLPRMRRPASGTRRAHFIRAQYHDGRVQRGGDGAHGFGWE